MWDSTYAWKKLNFEYVDNVKYIKNTDELIGYVNYKTEPGFPESSMGEEREDDKITKISFFSYGMYDGTIDLAYKYSDDLKITKSMIKNFDATAFDNPETFFGSCNAGTNQQSENDAYAQLWVNHIGGTAVAVNGKTDYSNINVGDKNWHYYLGAVRRKLGLFNTYGSLNGPHHQERPLGLIFAH